MKRLIAPLATILLLVGLNVLLPRITNPYYFQDPRHAGADHHHAFGVTVSHRPGGSGVPGRRHPRTRSGSCFMSVNRNAPAPAIASRSVYGAPT